MSYQTNVDQAALDNDFFRRVLFTGKKTQLVLMEIPVGGEIGTETHANVEQILFFRSGRGQAVLDGEVTLIEPGDVVVVTPGTKHNFRNTGDEALKLYTVYSPPNHIDGRVHRTKKDADVDVDDEKFGEMVE